VILLFFWRTERLRDPAISDGEGGAQKTARGSVLSYQGRRDPSSAITEALGAASLGTHVPPLPLFRCTSFKRRKVFHQQPVDKDIPAADSAEKDPLGCVVQEAHIAQRHYTIPPQYQAEGEM